MLAHIRNGTLIKVYPNEKGWVDLADGQRAAPPVAGFVSGDDKVVPYVEETVDNSTTANTTRSVETVVEADQVIRRTTISDVPSDDVAARVRAERNDRLSESDWVVTKAVEQNAADGFGIQIPMVWIDYRQALRDITKQAGFPHKVTWPQEP